MIRNSQRLFSSIVKPTVSVIGAGQMGAGIAQVSAMQAGCRTILVDQSQPQLGKAESLIARMLEKDVSKGRITAEQRDDAMGRISMTCSMDEIAESDFIIEAVSEDFPLKQLIFEALDKISKPEAIIASNTSSISITKLAAATQRPSQVIGMHFMNPVPVMKLVELISGLQTSAKTVETTESLAKMMGKQMTRSKDVPGFIANRLLMPYINEAVFALQEGIGTAEDIDTTMKLGTNVPMGPLTLADFIGLDTCLAIMKVLHKGLGEDKYRPAPLLVSYVDAGWLGRKSGRGFYSY